MGTLQGPIELPGGTFSANLTALRESRGWSRDELARRASLNPSAVHRLEDGSRQPRLGSILKLADAFGLTGSALLDGV